MKSENLKKAGGALMVVAGVALWAWVLLVIADVVTFFWAIGHFYDMFERYGTVNEFVCKGLAVIFAGLVVWFMSKVVLYIIRRRFNWVPIVCVGS